jgi:hypothetical protein
MLSVFFYYFALTGLAYWFVHIHEHVGTNGVIFLTTLVVMFLRKIPVMVLGLRALGKVPLSDLWRIALCWFMESFSILPAIILWVLSCLFWALVGLYTWKVFG